MGLMGLLNASSTCALPFFLGPPWVTAVMVVFVTVPMVAPALGQGILMVASWPAIFGVFLFQGTLFGNLTALAMKPLGRISGTGAAVVGALSLLIAALGGITIGRAYYGTVFPLVAGFGGLAVASLAMMSWTRPAGSVPAPAAHRTETD